nr:hypothetical protein [Lysinibacillus timonensis]
MVRFSISLISNYLVRGDHVGYATPDKKVVECLAEFIPEWADFLNVKVLVHKNQIVEEGKIIYRIWTTTSVES